MTWARVGDTSSTHPRLEATVTHPDADDRTRCEVFGWLMLCATASTAHDIEYFITEGVAIRQSGSPAAARRNIAVALHAGLITEVTLDGDLAYKILEDDAFIHLLTKEERDEAAQRKRDRNRSDLVVPARIRDGDACRYCGKIVHWGSNNSALGGTYEHLRGVSIDQDTKLEDYVVSCRGCNTLVKNLRLTYEQKLKKLMPPPVEPRLKPSSVDWLKANKWAIDNNIDIPKPWRRRLKVGEVAHAKTSDGSQSSKAGGPQGHSSTEGQNPALAAPPAVSADTVDDRPSSSVPAEVEVISGPCSRPDGSQPSKRPAESHTPSGPCSPLEAQDSSGPADGEAQEKASPTEVAHDANSEHAISPGMTSSRAVAQPVNCPAGQTGTGRVGSGRDGPGMDGAGLVGEDLKRSSPTSDLPLSNAARRKKRRRR